MSGRRVKKAYSGEKKDRSQRPLNVGPNKHRNKEAVDREPTPSVSEKELEELKMVFRLTDKNGDGSITSTELKEMLHTKLSIDVDDSLLTDLMNSAGEQAEGLISEQQFITWFLKMQTLSPSDGGDKSSDISTDLSAAFRLFDKDGNGFITIDELRRAMELIDEPLTEAELRSLIRMADADNNGKIDYEEFLKMLL
ncbi:Calcium-binding protein E63-1 [Amphibalanus amphitrite]|uniref:Calcium-binding protein E63-1 n=1 Tax=Amphibalanus amphitrite TaxID=1232801 RepID=A0A6A4W6F1_AMPAM|nr:Calcium-binding protein E63-1 [Amphibalanus amphitrite]